jgi:multidrug transporter EmrE-like cation transporter
MNIYVVIFITLVASLIASYAQVLFKTGLKKKIASIMDLISILKIPRVVCGLACYALSLVVYLYALSHAPLSVVYPTFASTFIFVALLSSVLLKEKISPMRAAGIAVIFLGIITVAATI